MKTKTKIKLGAAAIIGGAVAGLALNKALDSLVNTHLGKSGIQNPKTSVMSKKNQDDVASSPEVILGQLFSVTAPQITVTVPNREGRYMNALLYRRENESSKYAIVVHGYRAGVKAVSYIARRYYDAGYNVLVPHLRAHKGSDYDFCTMGWLERLDIIDWANYIDSIATDAQIVLHGVSMGAATVMMCAGESLPPYIKCIIEDCGYTSVFDAYSYKIPKMMRIPAFPSVNIFRRAIMKRVGFDIKEASALNQVIRSRTPILFLHGSADSVVPVSMAYELYDAAGCEKDMMIFKNADHIMSPLLYPDAYWGKVFEFIGKYSN
ncbi:MAG: alpha/beta fold hydrolase [Clostridia bacterium]|nr:alpha/beta fold hydrolase [Clostridia bacterium]